jgi:hypothetical protein
LIRGLLFYWIGVICKAPFFLIPFRIHEHEVSSNKIGEWVITELKALDEVAYIRFASVYRQFQDIEAFREEIEF